MFIYSLIMLCLFTFGVPIFYATVLYQARDLVYPRNAGRVIEVVEGNGTVTVIVHEAHVPAHDTLKLEGRLLACAVELKRLEAEVRRIFVWTTTPFS